MTFNRWVRQFLRREEAECLVDTFEFPEMLSLSGHFTFISMQRDPDLEAVDLFDVDDSCPFTPPQKVGVTWFPKRVGHDCKRLLPAGAYLLARHHGIGDVKIVVHIEICEPGVRISICYAQEDAARRDAIHSWVEDCGRRNNPFSGNLLALGRSALEFVTPRNIGPDDVHLPDEVLDTLRRSFAFLREPQAWPHDLRHRAVLLAGAPGVGKSLAARWLAEDLGVTAVWVTAGALCAVKPSALFEYARQLKPALVVLDDLAFALDPDGDAGRFGDVLGEMDGFTNLEDIGILATTNDLNTLDRALDPRSRPGRFHRLIELEPPDRIQRRALITRRGALAGAAARPSDATVERLVCSTAGFTGAQLAELVDEAQSRILWAHNKGESPNIDAVFDGALADRSRPAPVGFVSDAKSA